MTKYYFYADIERCIGCHACEVACQQEHGGDAKERIKIEESEVLDTQQGEVTVNFIPTILRNCLIESHMRSSKSYPVCMTVCPTRTILLDELEGLSRALSKRKSVILLRHPIVGRDKLTNMPTDETL